jgi:hypothetical protein
MNKPAAVAIVSSVLLGAAMAVPTHADACKHSAERTASIAGADIKRVVIAAGAGDLVVRGEQGRNDVKADGKACASSEQLLDGIRLESRRDGDTVYLRTVLPELSEVIFAFSRYAYLDVTIVVPRSATLTIDDSSGDMQVSEVQAATITDSSGDQTLRHVAGDLDVTDSSGEISVADVGGNLRLKDSSGDMHANTVKGDVLVTVDSSGEIDISKVSGSVHVLSDSSGDIGITDVQRDVTIDSDSSGGIRVQQVGGNFTVGSDGSGGIHYDRVLGSVQLPQDE